MAFKSFDKYMEDKNKNLFLLPEDKDYADVIFLYRSVKDVLVADTHYIKSPDYSGYVHCCGNGCPACAKGIRVQTKIFIPLYNYKTNRIEFWDRTNRFERQLQADVLSKFPNPSEWVFRITRNGASGSIDTTYSIMPEGRNASFPYEAILSSQHATFPDEYSTVCRDYSPGELSTLLNSNAASSSSSSTVTYDYVPSPRASASSYVVPSTSIPEPVSVVPPSFGQQPSDIADVPYVADIPFSESTTVASDSLAFTGNDTDINTDGTDDLGDVNF